MAPSILSLGMFAARAFCRTRRSVGLVSGLGPPDFTAIAMSLLIRVNSFAIRFQRANIVALRVSKMRPMGRYVPQSGGVRRTCVFPRGRSVGRRTVAHSTPDEAMADRSPGLVVGRDPTQESRGGGCRWKHLDRPPSQG